MVFYPTQYQTEIQVAIALKPENKKYQSPANSQRHNEKGKANHRTNIRAVGNEMVYMVYNSYSHTDDVVVIEVLLM